MSRKRISSLLTVFYKFILPAIFALSAINIIRYSISGWRFYESSGELTLIGVLAAAGVLLYGWMFFRIKKIAVDTENFYISNYRKEIILPIADVFDVNEMRWIQPYWITLHLRTPSEFGDKIVFVPPVRVLAFWTANPLVVELKQLIKSKKPNRFTPPPTEKQLFS